MRHLHFYVVLFLLLVFAGIPALAQTEVTDSTAVAAQATDSVNTALIRQYNQKLAQEEIQRQRDSFQRIALQLQIAKLRSSDSTGKAELEVQIQKLNSRETARLAEKRAQIDLLRKQVNGYPVKGFFKDTLFLIYNRLGSLSAADRAEVITKRIKDLKSDFSFAGDSLRVLPGETTLDIIAGERILMSISENDAIWNDTTTVALANRYRTVIATAVAQYRDETSWLVLAKEIGLALLALAVLVAVLFYVNKFFRWTAIKVQGEEGDRIKGIQIKDYTLFDASRQVKALLAVNRILKWLVILFCIYIMLPIVFGIFPWTRNFAHTLFGYVVNPVKRIAHSLWAYLPNLFTILVIIFLFRYIQKGLRFLKTEVEAGHLKLAGFYPDWAAPTYQILRVILYAFMFVLIFPYLPGSDSPVFQGVSVFLGFLFTFGSAGSLSNVMAGLVLTYMRLFKIGDRVKVGEVVGDVIEKSLLVTRVRTIKNEIVSIPNSTVMSSHTVNYSSETLEKGLIMHTTVTIGYDVPWQQIEGALKLAADRTLLLLKEPVPFVLQTSLEDFYVAYQINAYTKEANKQAGIYSELHRHIQDCCNEAGIEILSPHYRAPRDGNASTIPASYLPADYEAPAFRVQVETPPVRPAGNDKEKPAPEGPPADL